MLTPSPREVESLTGRYRFLVFATTGVTDQPRTATNWDVVLERPDSARLALARERPFGRYSRTDLRLVGTLRRAASPPVPVEWDDGLLMMGCRDCDRTSWDLFMIEAIRDDGFRGSWIGIPPTDRATAPPRGARAELPAVPTGYFCAVRIGLP
jgi:hypothetical protein